MGLAVQTGDPGLFPFFFAGICGIGLLVMGYVFVANPGGRGDRITRMWINASPFRCSSRCTCCVCTVETGCAVAAGAASAYGVVRWITGACYEAALLRAMAAFLVTAIAVCSLVDAVAGHREPRSDRRAPARRGRISGEIPASRPSSGR